MFNFFHTYHFVIIHLPYFAFTLPCLLPIFSFTFFFFNKGRPSRYSFSRGNFDFVKNEATVAFLRSTIFFWKWPPQQSNDLIKLSFLYNLAMQDGYFFNTKKTRPLYVLYEIVLYQISVATLLLAATVCQKLVPLLKIITSGSYWKASCLPR